MHRELLFRTVDCDGVCSVYVDDEAQTAGEYSEKRACVMTSVGPIYFEAFRDDAGWCFKADVPDTLDITANEFSYDDVEVDDDPDVEVR